MLSKRRPPIFLQHIFPTGCMPMCARRSDSDSRSRSPVSRGRRYRTPDSRSDSTSQLEYYPESITNRDFLVSSKGDINASFSVPGLISILSDNDSHNVTIIQLPLD